MKIRIVDSKDKYRGVGRSFPQWKLKWYQWPSSADIDAQLRYYEWAFPEDNLEHDLEEFIKMYRYFMNKCRDIEMIAICDDYIDDKRFSFLGIDVGSDDCESVFAGEQWKQYDFLNENKLIQEKELAEAYIVGRPCNEIGEELKAYYIYKFID